MEEDISRTTRLSSINRNNRNSNNNNNTAASSSFTSLSQPQLNSISQLADVQRRIGLIRNRSLLRAAQREARNLEHGGGAEGEGEAGEMTLDEDLRNEAFTYIMNEAQRVSNEVELEGRGIGGIFDHLNPSDSEVDYDIDDTRVARRDHFWVDGSDDDDDDSQDEDEVENEEEEEDQEMMEPESFYERESSFLPGLFATYPLNPSTSTRRRLNRRQISPTPTPGSVFQTPHTSPPPTSNSKKSKLSKLLSVEELALSDQHTSSSPTSFLQTGMVFVGIQYYIPSIKKSSRRRPLSDSEEESHSNPNSNSNNASSSNTSRHQQPLPPHRLPMSVALESMERPSLTLVQNFERSNIDNLSIGEMEAQISAYQIESDILRSQTRRFQEAHRITMDYLRRADNNNLRAVRNEENSSSRSRDEKWEVKVFIESYNHTTQSLTGLMQATNIPSCPVVITYFKGKILNPITKILWYNWSQNDIEYWHQLGKFKTSTKEEMWIRRKDYKWIEEMMKGWIYMYWQEEQFINLTASESKLSIQGRYIVALERSSGVIEGVYNDPHSAPTQRISLSACRNDSIGFSTFSYA